MDNMVMARDIDAIASPSSTFTLVMSFFICASLFFRGLQSALRTTPAMRIAEMSIVAPMTARVTVSVSFKHTQEIAMENVNSLRDVRQLLPRIRAKCDYHLRPKEEGSRNAEENGQLFQTFLGGRARD